MSSRTTRPECSYEECGSRRLHVGDDGFTYCDRGHQQSDRGTIIAEDTGELTGAGRKSKRRDSSDAESNVSKFSGFGGARAFEHHLLCLQLILRKQLRWLVEVQKLPEELESLVRDLWATRLQRLKNKVSYDSETDTEGQFSSQSEDKTTDTDTPHRSQRNREKLTGGTPNLLDTLALLYLGLLMLREAVTVADIHRWVNDGGLLYYRASKEVPLSMRERLPATYQDLLEPQTILQAPVIQRKIMEMVELFSEAFGMSLPPINHTLILYGWVKELMLSIEVFTATKRLAKTLNIDFTYPTDAKAERPMSLRSPETRLGALMVISTKLLFPFDGVERSAHSAADLSALSLDWAEWIRVQASASTEVRDGLGYEQALALSEGESLQIADDKLDGYLDWYGDNIAAEAIREHGKAGRDADFRRTLFNMFPASDNEKAKVMTEGKPLSFEQSEISRLQKVQATLKPRRIALDDGEQQNRRDMGSLYRRFRNEEELEGPAKTFYQEAARLAGSSLHDMIKAVFAVEILMQKQEEQLRKAKIPRR